MFLVVMAGGSGTRFWPKSTSKRPKQLLSFGRDPSSLLAQTVSRFEGLISPNRRMIITTQMLKEPVRGQGLNAEILAEPQGRNTAPCIYWAAKTIFAQDPHGIMLVMPADHHILFPKKFIVVVEEAVKWAIQNDHLVTLGIRPSRPETGYGYLEMGETLDPVGARKVKKFVEKPNLAKANEFVQSGNYLWNGGMFLWKASEILKAFDLCMPEMTRAWNQANGKIEDAYPQMTATSVDYGIMEKAENVITFPIDCGWDDLGSWTSLETMADALDTRKGENVLNQGDLLSIDSFRNIVDAPHRLVSLLGVDDLIVVEQGECLLVAHKNRAQDIRQVVEEMKKKRPDLV
jgi:mannose-1-phosphate guanylyltransferase